MTKIIVDLPSEIDEMIAIYKIKNKLVSKDKAIVQLLDSICKKDKKSKMIK